MYLKLCSLFGDSAEENVVVRGSSFIVGRAADCDLQLMHGTVSRHHCQLSTSGPYPTIQDLDSSNGTYLNGHLVCDEQVLRSGDKISLGMVVLEVQDIGAPVLAAVPS